MKVSKRIFDLETESAFAILAKANKLQAEGKDIIERQNNKEILTIVICLLKVYYMTKYGERSSVG